MTRLQIIVVGLSIVFLFGMYFGLETKPPKQQLIEKSRVASFEQTDIQNLIQEAQKELDPAQAEYFSSLTSIASGTSEDSVQVELYKQLSGEWFKLGKPSIAGFFAEKVAEIENTEESWSIAGTTHAYGLTLDAPEKYKSYSASRATTCFENAISLNPENLQHRVNLAIRYAEYPLENDPMKGILMLLDLDKKHPDNATILFQLGRFAIRTGQFERAIVRLERAQQLAPEFKQIPCFLAEALTGAGRMEEAVEAKRNCK